jgi:thiol:disulfide interchange protein DsbC
MHRPLLIITLLTTLWVPVSQAADTDNIRTKLEKNLVNAKIEDIKPSVIPGLYRIKLDGQLVYASRDGSYLLHGSIFDVETGNNLTTLAVLESIKDKDTLVFAPKKTKHTVTIFTDTSCGYCRKLHQEVPKLNENGVKVRYLLYPRAGLQSRVASIMQSIWCADNQQEALTTVKAGGSVPNKQCDNPIEQHIELARQMGLRGTPMIVMDTGQVIPGYKPAEQLIADLNAD